jgi:hypothetical protein
MDMEETDLERIVMFAPTTSMDIQKYPVASVGNVNVQTMFWNTTRATVMLKQENVSSVSLTLRDGTANTAKPDTGEML